MFRIDVVIEFSDGQINEHNIQSFIAQCMNQQLQYQTPDLGQRIEEALEE